MKLDSQDFFGDLLEEIRASGLEFIVCGGVAAILHGVERTTLDVRRGAYPLSFHFRHVGV